MKSSRKREHRCACCTRKEKLERHHCHLEKVVSLAIHDALGFGGDQLSEQKVYQRNSGWARCDRTLAVVRFHPTLICHTCNLIDGLYLDSKPGPHFSLTPNEIRTIRAMAGNDKNVGNKFEGAIRRVRAKAVADYRDRFARADILGAVYAAEWLADPKIQAMLQMK